MIKLKTLLLSLTFFGLCGCSAIVDDALRQNLIGSWEAFEVINTETNDTLTSPIFGFPEILNGRFCDSFTLTEEGDFNGYSQIGSNTSGVVDGTWLSDFNIITITFDDGEVISRSVDLNGDILGIRDTISAGPRYIRFQGI